MQRSAISYNDYKNLLNDLVTSHPRGTKRQLAAFCKCQESYMSSVLNGSKHLNNEQLEAACRFFHLTDAETQFALLLLQENRSCTAHLKSQLKKMIEKQRKEHTRLQDVLDIKKTLASEDQARYYSSWYYAAVHMLLLIEDYRRPDKIATKLGLQITLVIDILQFLVSIGAASKRLDSYFAIQPQLHLDGTSPLIQNHHRNWRLKTIQSLEIKQEHDLHYSGVVTISSDDFQKVRDLISLSLKNSVEVIRKSKDERLAAICLDLYML
jgi:uncharacterized protein (TIGR02147 family)